MNRFNLEWAIAAWRRQYDTRHLFGRADLDELERHVRDQTSWFVEQGMEQEEAFRRAVKELGSVFEAEDEYRKVFWKKLRTRGEVAGELRWRLSMLRRYLHIGARTMARQKVVSFINVFGLSIALACCICVYVFLDTYIGMDDFHEKGDRIQLVSHSVVREGEIQRWGRTPLALASSIRDQVPGVEEIVRVAWESGRIVAEEAAVQGSIYFVDPGYLDVLTFPIRSGDPRPLDMPDGVAITTTAAQKYFGDTDPVGRTISFVVSGEKRIDLTVRSVLAPLPGASGTRFEILAPLPTLISARNWDETDWTHWTSGTILLTAKNANLAAVEAGLNALIPMQNAAEPDWQMASFFLDNLRDPVDRSYTINNRLMEAPHPAFIIILILIPVAMLMLSVFNYVNIAIGAAERRVREIGIRKVSGGVRTQLVAQFLVENLVLCTVSLAVAALISWLFLLPLFDELFVYAISWAPVQSLEFWVVILVILFGTSFISGAYPALVISSLDPVAIFRGSQAMPGRKLYSHILLAIQFTIAFLCILIGMYMTWGGDFVARDGWGYDPEPIVTVRLEEPGLFGPFRDELEGLAAVEQITSALQHVGRSNRRTQIRLNGEDVQAGGLAVGPGYFDLMGMRVIEGRGFDPAFGADGDYNVIINASLARRFGPESPIGRGFSVDSTQYQVVGVVENPMTHPIFRYQPLFFSLESEERANFAVVKAASGGSEELMPILRAAWEKIYPDRPFDAYEQRTVFDIDIASWTNIRNAIGWLAMLALIISCMGLFGLASQGVSARMKEISIRKVLGANPTIVALKVHTKYLVLISVGAAISMPIVYFGLTTAIEFAELYHIKVGPGIFIGSYALVMGVAFVSVSRHAWRLMRVNPTETLRGD